MDLSALQTLIGSLTNDPQHDRYTTSDIGTELDNSQDKWNVEAKIIKDTVTLTIVDGTRQYVLSGLTGTPISFLRVTHKGLELEKVDKIFMDLYTGSDWTQDIGTPKRFFIEATDPDIQYLAVHPTPQAADAGANLVVEYIKRHTALSASTDKPFNGNDLLLPYHYGLAYDTASRLLSRDPSPQNSSKVITYQREAGIVMANVVQVFKALEKQEPWRLKGGRVF